MLQAGSARRPGSDQVVSLENLGAKFINPGGQGHDLVYRRHLPGSPALVVKNDCGTTCVRQLKQWNLMIHQPLQRGLAISQVRNNLHRPLAQVMALLYFSVVELRLDLHRKQAAQMPTGHPGLKIERPWLMIVARN